MTNITIGTSRAKMNDLLGQRADLLAAAERELAAGNNSEYKSLFDKATALNAQIDDYKAVVDEYDRYDIKHAPTFGSDNHDMKAMGEHLKAGERVNIMPQTITNAIERKNSVGFSGSLVTPTGGGSQINDGVNTQVSTLIHQVRVETFEGMASYEEPYLVSMQEATHGSVKTVSGTERTSSDPVWRKAKLTAHEVQVTTYVDRNIADLSPVAYAKKCQGYALLALYRDINKMICSGDSLPSHEFFGLLNAKNTDDENIFQTAADITEINEDTLRNLVFGYGGDEEVAANARLVLSKQILDKFGRVKIKSDDNRKLYDITQTGNTGTIKEGGLTVPFTICSGIGNAKIAYGDTIAFLLGLFGAYSIRIDASYRAVQRQLTILGDVKVGGNLVVDKGFSVANLT